ncbi:MAG: FecR family protein [Kofleriaceae bacterium]
MSRSPRPSPPPIEELSELSWARIEHKVFAELDRAPAAAPAPAAARRRWALIVAPVAALAAAAAVVVLATGGDAGSRGTVAVGPTRVEAGATEQRVDFADAELVVGAAGAVILDGDAATGALVVLERGTVALSVAPRVGRPPLRVLAGEVAIQVIGTRFTVEREGDGARVDVTEGTVEVTYRGGRTSVHGGASWAPAAVSARDPDETVPPVAVTDPPPAPVELVPDASPAPAPAAKPNRRPTARAPVPAHGSAAPPATDDVAVPAPSARDRFARASALEAADPDQALALYRELAAGDGAWAANAAYAIARLWLDRGDLRGAARAAERYLARFPGGPNAADARDIIRRAAAHQPRSQGTP